MPYQLAHGADGHALNCNNGGRGCRDVIKGLVLGTEESSPSEPCSAQQGPAMVLWHDTGASQKRSRDFLGRDPAAYQGAGSHRLRRKIGFESEVYLNASSS